MAQGQSWSTKARIIQAGTAALVLIIALACATPATTPAVGSPHGLGSSASASASVAAAPSAAHSGSPEGASLPCERSLDWKNPAPDEACRDQGQLCSDMQKHVIFPICDKTILEKVVPLKTFEKRQSAPAELAIRGYLRRHRLMRLAQLMSTDDHEKVKCHGDRPWELRMERKASDKLCGYVFLGSPSLPNGIGLGPRGFNICRGDSTVACCVSDLIDSDHEIVMYWEDDHHPNFCVPKEVPQEKSAMFLRRNDPPSPSPEERLPP